MSYGKFMRTSRSFLELIGVPKKEAQSVKYNYIRRFLPTLGEVLRVDTTEAQSLSNWIEIAHGRDRGEARASHPTSRHYAGDKLTSSGLVKAMCVGALCQVVPCDKRDCRQSFLSITWFDVRVALPDLDLAWQRALYGLKDFSTHTSDHFPKGKVVAETVPSHRVTSTASHAADPSHLFDMTDAPEVVVHRGDLNSSTVNHTCWVSFSSGSLKDGIDRLVQLWPDFSHSFRLRIITGTTSFISQGRNQFRYVQILRTVSP